MNDVSVWVKQARYRAKRNGVINDLTTAEALEVLRRAAGVCAYCGAGPATHLDNPLPFIEGGPNVPANVAACCADCKTHKRNHSLTWLFEQGYVGRERYIALVRELLNRRGGAELRPALRRCTGMLEEDQ